MLLAGTLTLLAGCSDHPGAASLQPSESPSAAVQPAPGLAAGATAKPTPAAAGSAAAAVHSADAESSVTGASFEIIGEYIVPWNNALHTGIVEISETDAGGYHLRVSVVYGYAQNLGEMDSDFYYDGTNYVCTEPGYESVTLAFDERSITIDYPEEGWFGGFNAEPRGTYYLKNSGPADTPFLTRLYDKIGLEEVSRGYFSDVLTYSLNDTTQVLLVQSRSGFEAEDIYMENLVLFHMEDQRFEPLGTVAQWNEEDLRERLKAFEPDLGLINQLLHKQQADRYTELHLEKFNTVPEFDPSESKLTDAEAFYVVTGITDATSISNNRRDTNDIGSIFIREVDHSDDSTVFIHSYETVRNSEDDQHTATSNWTDVDRTTGIITEMF